MKTCQDVRILNFDTCLDLEIYFQPLSYIFYCHLVISKFLLSTFSTLWVEIYLLSYLFVFYFLLCEWKQFFDFSNTISVLLAGLKYAGSRNANAQELLYSYAIYFLNEVFILFILFCHFFQLIASLMFEFCRLSLFLVQLVVCFPEGC